MTPEQIIHPGRILVRELKERGITQKQLAEMLSRPQKWVCEIVTGRKSIVAESALDLELALSIPAENWMNLQSNYDIEKARLFYDKKIKTPKPRKYVGGQVGSGKINKNRNAIIALSQNYTNAEIAKMLGHSTTGIQRALERWGIKNERD